MGLNFRQQTTGKSSPANWSYGGFMKFRIRLAASCGLLLEPENDSLYDDGCFKLLEAHPIWPLINHSDCDGEMSIEEMKLVVPSLILIINNWIDTDEDIKFDKVMGLHLIQTMEDCIMNDEPLVFT